MTKPFIPIISFLILLLIIVYCSFQFTNATGPGWHTTIFPPYFIWKVGLVIILLFLTIGYWLFIKRVNKRIWILFAIHCTLTTSMLLFINVPAIFLDLNHYSHEEFLSQVLVRVKLIPVARVICIAAQYLFFVYYIMTIKVDRSKVSN